MQVNADRSTVRSAVQHLKKSYSRPSQGCSKAIQKGALRENDGGRRSRKDAKPSTGSGPENPNISSATEASNVGPARRNQLLSEYLVHCIAAGAPSANRVATDNAVSWSAASSTANETSPNCSAFSPVTGSLSRR